MRFFGPGRSTSEPHLDSLQVRTLRFHLAIMLANKAIGHESRQFFYIHSLLVTLSLKRLYLEFAAYHIPIVIPGSDTDVLI